MNEKPKLCIDCKHYRGTRNRSHEWCDRRRGAAERSLVNGKPINYDCPHPHTERHFGACGKDAKFFEPKDMPKPGLFSRLFGNEG